MKPAKSRSRRRRDAAALEQLKMLTPYVDEGREPLEVLAVLAGKAAFLPEIHEGADEREFFSYGYRAAARLGLPRLHGIAPPTYVSGSRSDWSLNLDKITPLDVAQALASHRDRLATELAKAIACQDVMTREARTLLLEGLRARVLRDLSPETCRRVSRADGGNRHRVRIVLWDVFHELIRPGSLTSLDLAARGARMRKATYLRLFREVESILRHTANNAARSAIDYLRGRNDGSSNSGGEQQRRTRADRVGEVAGPRDEGAVVERDDSAGPVPAAIAWRPGALSHGGVLRLRGRGQPDG